MKKTTALLTALILMLSGCGMEAMNYPRATLSPAAVRPVTIDVTIPVDAEEAILTALLTFEAKLSELSGGNIKIEIYHAGDVKDVIKQGETGLYLLSDRQVIQLEERLAFIQMPFLFRSAEELLTLLNSATGEVRTSSLIAEHLGGEVIGVYYGGTTWFLGKSKFYDEIGFFNSMGVLSDTANNACFSVLGAQNIIEGTEEELFAAFANDKIKFCELRTMAEIPDETLAKVKNLELTNHRFATEWLILCDPQKTLSSSVCSMIKEAFAYTLLQHDTMRRELETERMVRLQEKLNLTLDEEAGYSHAWQLAARYYRANWKAMMIPPKIWEEISVIKGY